MKKKLCLVMLVAGCLLAAGCQKTEGVSNSYIEIAKYKGLEVEKVEKQEFSDEDVTSYIESQMAQNTKEVTDRPLKKGDIAVFEYKGKLKKNGEVFDEGTLSLGNGESYVGGFEEGIYGHKIGETFDVELTFPEGYGGEEKPELSKAEVIFTIKILSIQEKEFSELTDAYVKSVSKTAKTVDEYKKEVKKELEEKNYRSGLINNTMVALEKQVKVKKYPEDRLKKEQERIGAQMKVLIEQYYGMTFEKYLEEAGLTKKQYDEQLKASAQDYLKNEMTFELIAKKEKLELSKEELEKEMASFAKENGYDSVDAMIQQNGKEQVEAAILQNKVLDWVADESVEVEKPKQEEKKESSENNETQEK